MPDLFGPGTDQNKVRLTVSRKAISISHDGSGFDWA